MLNGLLSSIALQLARYLQAAGFYMYIIVNSMFILLVSPLYLLHFGYKLCSYHSFSRYAYRTLLVVSSP